MIKILGLDVSTTTIGLSVLQLDGEQVSLIHCEFYKPPKIGTIFERLQEVKEYITSKLKEFSPDEVALEDIVLFMKGKSTAKTITSLAIMNRFVGFTVYEVMGKEPHLLNVLKIRHSIKKDNKFPAKEEIPELIASHLGIEFPYVKNTKGKNKGKNVIENFDVADSIAVAYCYILDQIKPKKKKPKKK